MAQHKVKKIYKQLNMQFELNSSPVFSRCWMLSLNCCRYCWRCYCDWCCWCCCCCCCLNVGDLEDVAGDTTTAESVGF